jgi:hypothetical protein
MVPFGRLLDALSEVPDPRRAEGKRYPLAPLLLFTVLALLFGATKALAGQGSEKDLSRPMRNLRPVQRTALLQQFVEF